MESRELGFESRFYPKCFHFLPLGDSCTTSFVFEAETAVQGFSSVLGPPAPTLFTDQLELVNACKIFDTCKMARTQRKLFINFNKTLFF